MPRGMQQGAVTARRRSWRERKQVHFSNCIGRRTNALSSKNNEHILQQKFKQKYI